MTTAVVSAPPRIHIALADMARATMRSYGGIGFAFNGPPVTWVVKASSSTEVEGIELLDQGGASDITKLLALMRTVRSGVHVHARLLAHPPQHSGYGTKTTLLLALARAVDHIHSLGLTRRELQALTGRGGTSGIGSATFFDGGVVVDAGHSTTVVDQLLPSCATRNEAPPPVIARWDFPEAWKVTIALPPSATLSGVAEIEFFRTHTPIPTLDALETIGLIHHGLMPGFATSDLEAVADALVAIHNVGFKRVEYMACDPVTQGLLHALHDEGLAAGISSTGPLVYIITDGASSLARAHAVVRSHGLCAHTYDGNNAGHRLEVG